MLRNYTSTDTNNKDVNSIIINKQLITKPIETSNLSVNFTKQFENNSYSEEANFGVYRIIVHINNKFNPTKINLFDNENNIHFYQLYEDNTLHINMSLITFLKIL